MNKSAVRSKRTDGNVPIFSHNAPIFSHNFLYLVTIFTLFHNLFYDIIICHCVILPSMLDNVSIWQCLVGIIGSNAAWNTSFRFLPVESMPVRYGRKKVPSLLRFLRRWKRSVREKSLMRHRWGKKSKQYLGLAVIKRDTSCEKVWHNVLRVEGSFTKYSIAA